MDRDSIKEQIIKIVSEQLAKPAAEITEENKFVEDLGADSLDNVELVMELERQFEIEIPDEKSMEITSVGEAINHIDEHLKSKS